MIGAAARWMFFFQWIRLIQGTQSIELHPHPAVEAVVGQNISIPCILEENDVAKITLVEWKKEQTQLGVLTGTFEKYQAWPNLTIQAVKSNSSELQGTILHLPHVKKWDSGDYICYVATFPFGSIRSETKLTVKDDVQIICNATSALTVPYRGNVNILCRTCLNAKYEWTKNGEVVSEQESLELKGVTDAHDGVYKLTVYTEDQTSHKEFKITVLAETTTVADVVTLSLRNQTAGAPSTSAALSPALNGTTHPNPRNDSTEDSLFNNSVTGDSNTTDSVSKDSLYNGSVTNDSVTKNPQYNNSVTEVLVTNGSLYNGSVVTVSITTPEQHKTFPIRPVIISAFPDNSSEIAQMFNFTTVMTDMTQSAFTPDEPAEKTTEQHPELQTGDTNSTTSGEFNTSTKHGAKKEETPFTKPTVAVRHTTAPNGDHATRLSHLLLVAILTPVVLSIAVIGFFCGRRLMRKRMDLPPSFKPPPPPVKYAAINHADTPNQVFSTSTCNSTPGCANNTVLQLQPRTVTSQETVRFTDV